MAFSERGSLMQRLLHCQAPKVLYLGFMMCDVHALCGNMFNRCCLQSLEAELMNEALDSSNYVHGLAGVANSMEFPLRPLG